VGDAEEGAARAAGEGDRGLGTKRSLESEGDDHAAKRLRPDQKPGLAPLHRRTLHNMCLFASSCQAFHTVQQQFLGSDGVCMLKREISLTHAWDACMKRRKNMAFRALHLA
jgi:hypothetical protein